MQNKSVPQMSATMIKAPQKSNSPSSCAKRNERLYPQHLSSYTNTWLHAMPRNFRLREWFTRMYPCLKKQNFSTNEYNCVKYNTQGGTAYTFISASANVAISCLNCSGQRLNFQTTQPHIIPEMYLRS